MLMSGAWSFRCSSFMRRVHKWWCGENKHVQGCLTWEHPEHVNLECLQKKLCKSPLVAWPPWNLNPSMLGVGVWFPTETQNSKPWCSMSGQKNPKFFFCYVDIFLCIKKDKEEMLQSFQSRIFKVSCSEKYFDCFDLFEHKHILRGIFLQVNTVLHSTSSSELVQQIEA